MAKLFAKHIKLEEQRTLLLARACGIACGTPHRLGKLADEGALSTERLRLLLIDLHVDAKQRQVPMSPPQLPQRRGSWTGHDSS